MTKRYGLTELPPILPADTGVMVILLHWLGLFTFEPMQAEHLMVIIRGQTRETTANTK